MKTVFHGKKIAGVLTVLPQNEVFFDDEIENYTFPKQQTLRLKKAMGYNKHRLSKEGTTPSDLALYGMRYLFDNDILSKDDIGAIVVVSITPDYFVPQISHIIHGNLELSKDVICLDISQACCGFVYGMMEAFLLLDHFDENKNVVVVNADVLSHKVSKKDRNSFPLIGDAATITVVENSRFNNEIPFLLKADGSRREALIIPAGGLRLPSNEETAKLLDDGTGNWRSLNDICMDGTEIFEFAMREVPPMIEDITNYAKVRKDEIDYFIFHQPNKFMLQKIADMLEVDREKVFMNIVANYGNTSGASIPMDITHNMREDNTQNVKRKCLIAAFGAGLNWGALIMDLGNMNFCDTIISDL